jgi:hypothetical protein
MLRSISVEAAQASWRSEYEVSLQVELLGYGTLLGAWLAARPQASATAGMPIKPEPNAELNTPPPPTAKEVDELKSAVDLAICDLAALESIMLPAAPASSALRMTLYQTRFEGDLLQYSVAMSAWVGALPQASSSAGVQVTSDPEADTTPACTAAPEEVVEGQMFPSTPMLPADGAEALMIPSLAHLLTTEATQQQLEVQTPMWGSTATNLADVCKECVIHMAISRLGCTAFPIGKPSDISRLVANVVCGSNTGLAGLSLLPTRLDFGHSRETCKNDIRSRLSNEEKAKYQQVRKNMHRTLAKHLKI